MKDIVKVIGIFLLVIGLIGGGLGVFCFKMDKWSCSEKSEKMGYEWSYSVPTGCMVKKDGRWLEYRLLREIDILGK